MEFIAYTGDYCQIEWYFDCLGRSPALEYYESLSKNERIKLLRLFKRMGDAGEIKDKTKFINKGDKIYAFKPQPERFLCFFYEGGKVIVTNGFKKKQQKLPLREKEKALKHKLNYLLRNKQGDYYEKTNAINI